MSFELDDGCGGSNLERDFVPDQDGFSYEGMLAVIVLVSGDLYMLLCCRACDMSSVSGWNEGIDYCW